MDVLEMLSKELETTKDRLTKRDLLLQEKERLLYLRICQRFTYDSRIHYVDLLGTKGESLKQEILNKRFDLRNVTDFRGVCSSISDAYATVLKKLLGVNAHLHKGGHVWAEFDNIYGRIKADATMGDLTRAKIGIATKGYRLLEDDSLLLEIFKRDLIRADIACSYIKWGGYPNFLMQMLYLGKSTECKNLVDSENKFKDSAKRDQFVYDVLMEHEENLFKAIKKSILEFSCSYPFISKDCQIPEKLTGRLLYKKELDRLLLANINIIEEIFNQNLEINAFEDAKFTIDYFLREILCSNEIVEGICLFDNSDEDNWEFINIYPIRFKGKECETIYMALKKEKGRYCFHSISYEEVKSLLNGYKGINKHLVLSR